jgi:quinol-cytochrome oxidoreductase complex cytochrome b subunit
MTTKKFYPDYLAEILFVALVCIEILLVIALLSPQTIGRQIDFTRPFQPLPEWYFLWIFQLVRYFPGNSAFVGAVVVPLLFVLCLAAIPYIDRGENGRLKATIAACGLLTIVIVFTLLSLF